MTMLRTSRITLSVAIFIAACAGIADPAFPEEAGGEAYLEITPVSFSLGEEVHPIDLAWVVGRALDQSLDLALAKAENRMAGAELRDSQARLFPYLEVDAGGGRVDGRVQGSFGELREVRFDRYDPSVGLVYRSDPAADLFHVLSRNKAKQAADLDLLDTERRVLLTVSGLYLNLIRTQAMQVAAERMEKLGQRILEIARGREASGIGSEADVSLAEANLAEAQVERADARGRWRTTAARLSVALREDPDVFLVSSEQRLVPWVLVDPGGADGAAGNRAEVRPDLLSAHRTAEAASFGTTGALLDLLLPDVEGSARRVWTGDAPDRLDERDDLSVRLIWSLGLRPIAEIEKARAHEEATRIRERRLEVEIRGEITALREAVSVGGERVEAAAARLSALKRSLDIQTARYEMGTALGIEVLAAESALMEAYRSAADAITVHNLSQVELLFAEGRLTAELLTGERRRLE